MELNSSTLMKMTYGELKEYAQKVFETLRLKAYQEGYEQGKFDAKAEKVAEHKNLTRDFIIYKAKNDIKNLVSDGITRLNNGERRKVQFIVDRKKRTIVALLRGVVTNFVIERAIAKCAPNDCFNSHIGKAIALRRVLGLEVPDEYINAPQPTEIRIGDVVRNKYTGWAHEVVFENRRAFIDKEFEIIDDSREEL